MFHCLLLQGEVLCPTPYGSPFCSTGGLCLEPPSAATLSAVNASSNPPTLILLGPAEVAVGKGTPYAACPPNPTPSLICYR